MNDVLDVKARETRPQAQVQPPAFPQGYDLETRARNLKAVGWVSYLLHLAVALAAVIPGLQVGVAVLILALLVLGLAIWLGLPYAFVFLAVWAVAFFGPIVVIDLTVRQRLGIRSRRGTYAPLAVALAIEAAGLAGGWMLAVN